MASSSMYMTRDKACRNISVLSIKHHVRRAPYETVASPPLNTPITLAYEHPTNGSQMSKCAASWATKTRSTSGATQTDTGESAVEDPEEEFQ